MKRYARIWEAVVWLTANDTLCRPQSSPAVKEPEQTASTSAILCPAEGTGTTNNVG